MDNNNNNTQPAYQPQPRFGSALIFRKIFLPSFLFALLFSLCMHQNLGSVLSIPLTLGLILYIAVVSSRLNTKLNHKAILPGACIIALGISNAFTANTAILVSNNLGIFLLTLVLLLYTYYPDTNWGFGQWFVQLLGNIFGSIDCLGDFVADAKDLSRNSDQKKNSRGLAFLIGFAIGIPLFFIVLLLLSKADAVFHSVLLHVIPENFSIKDVFGYIFCFIFALFASYCGMRRVAKRSIMFKPGSPAHSSHIIAYTILLPMTLLYLVFSMIQILYLFIGNMKLPDNLTYSEYAHEGFNQLLAVVIINFIVVVAILYFFKRSSTLKALLFTFSACTYIMIASAVMRMLMYIGAYDLSVLRCEVLWLLATIAMIMLGVLVYIFDERFHLAGYVILAFSLAYLVLSFGRVDYVVASYNLRNVPYAARIPYDATNPYVTYNKETDVYEDESDGSYDSIHANDQKKIMNDSSDIIYLSELSMDAAEPIFRTGNQELIERFVMNAEYDYKKAMTWRTYNFSRARFEQLKSEAGY